ncbi:TadE/TadG family type IV pilus assembly protein [Meridianimarinicoccus sp. RP-17]|uniref:TadE/TadG family type IV pilus assembly protein n=1 Tax=Meridianimarinicoccus zhengii TaxID=2056810 RepID=UPI000DAE0A67|nr:TadE/TadG family type IV pilus assembly protein [Phycocomes zhengii]
MKRLADFMRRTEGATAIEFAIVAMPLILLLVGTLELGRVLFIQNELALAADRGVRTLLVTADTPMATIETQIRDTFSLTPPAGLAVTLATDGTGFRTLRIDYPVELLIPTLVTPQITLTTERRVP